MITERVTRVLIFSKTFFYFATLCVGKMPPKGSTVEPKIPAACATDEQARKELQDAQNAYDWTRVRSAQELGRLWLLKRQVAKAAGKKSDQLPGEDSWVKFMRLIERAYMDMEQNAESDDLQKTWLKQRAAVAGSANVEAVLSADGRRGCEC